MADPARNTKTHNIESYTEYKYIEWIFQKNADHKQDQTRGLMS